MLPSADTIADLKILGTGDMAHLFGIKRHTLTMRMQRGHPLVPPEPDAKLDGCLIWFVTEELVADLEGKGCDVEGIV